MNQIKWDKKVCTETSKCFLTIKSCSLGNAVTLDPEAQDFIYERDVVSDRDLGLAIKQSLEKSGRLSPKNSKDLHLRLNAYLHNSINKIKAWLGLRFKPSMFAYTSRCYIELQEKTILIKPTHHETLESWSSDKFTDADYVRVPVDASYEEIGAALRVAFSRCTSEKFQ